MTEPQRQPYEKMNGLVVQKRFRTLLESNGLNTLDALLAHDMGDRMDKAGLPGWRERIRLNLGDKGDVVLYLKRYTSPPPHEQRSRFFAGAARHGTAWLEWRRLRKVARDGVQCAQPVVFGESMSGFRERGSVLATLAVDGVSLERWSSDHAPRASRQRLTALARVIRRFHRLGYIHRDLYLCHIFYNERCDGERAFTLIDLQRTIRPNWLRKRWLTKDLASLNYSTPPTLATRTDRIRFLRCWLGTARLRGPGKRLVRRIVAKTKRIARHDAQKRARQAAS